MATVRQVLLPCLRFWGWALLLAAGLMLPAGALTVALQAAFAGGVDHRGDFEVAADDPTLLPIALAMLWAAVWATRIACRRERLSLAAAGFRRPRWMSDSILGLAIGTVSFGLVVALAAAGGWVSLGQRAEGLALLQSLAGSILVLLPAAAAEEILDRGLPLAVLARRSVPFAVGSTALLFALMHGPNPGFSLVAFLDLVVVGVTLAVARWRSGGLWLPIGWHFGWNLAQGWIFGCAVSGADPTAAPLLGVRLDGPALLVGGRFGPESGLLALLADLAALAAFVRFYPRRSPAPTGLDEGLDDEPGARDASPSTNDQL